MHRDSNGHEKSDEMFACTCVQVIQGEQLSTAGAVRGVTCVSHQCSGYQLLLELAACSAAATHSLSQSGVMVTAV
jgi:hypothetical protein